MAIADLSFETGTAALAYDVSLSLANQGAMRCGGDVGIAGAVKPGGVLAMPSRSSRSVLSARFLSGAYSAEVKLFGLGRPWPHFARPAK